MNEFGRREGGGAILATAFLPLTLSDIYIDRKTLWRG